MRGRSIEACAKLGIKAFLDEEHIGWGENFTKKINTALGAARTMLCIVSPSSVAKEWPVLEMNAALSFDANRQKTVVPLMVGRPDLTKLPLMAAKDFLDWSGDAELVAHKLRDVVKGRTATTPPPPKPSQKAAPRSPSRAPAMAPADYWSLPGSASPGGTSVPAYSRKPPAKRGFWARLFGRK